MQAQEMKKGPRLGKFFWDGKPKIKLQKARILEGLPFGNLGDSAIVCKGKMEGRKEPVALKISRGYGSIINNAFEDELEKSRKLSMLLPNAASYYSMVDVQGQPLQSAFAMEIVFGYPILGRNLDCIDAGRVRHLISKRAVGQLAASLKIAASNGWGTDDLQYFVLLEDQTLNGRKHKKGDLMLFDFYGWHEGAKGTGRYFDAQISRLANWLKK